MATHIKFEDTVSYLLARVSTAFRNSLERLMGEIGLHGGQIFVLFELWQQDGLRQVDIANRLGVSAPTVNKMLKGLAENASRHLILVTATPHSGKEDAFVRFSRCLIRLSRSFPKISPPIRDRPNAAGLRNTSFRGVAATFVMESLLTLKHANPTGLAPVARGILHYSASRETDGSVVQNPVNHWDKPSGGA